MTSLEHIGNIMSEAEDGEKRGRRARVTSQDGGSGGRVTRRLREQIKKLLKLSEAQTALSWAIVFVLTVTIATLYVNQASRTAEIGRYIQELRLDLQTLKRENGVIEQEIAKSQSLDRLQTRANALGFTLADPTDRLYVTVDQYPTEVDTTLFVEPTPPPELVVVETMEEALWLSLFGRLESFTSGSADSAPNLP